MFDDGGRDRIKDGRRRLKKVLVTFAQGAEWGGSFDTLKMWQAEILGPEPRQLYMFRLWSWVLRLQSEKSCRGGHDYVNEGVSVYVI